MAQTKDSFPQLDLSGKLIIKVQLGDDIRRIPIHNEDITYDELVLMMQRVYRGQLSNNDEIAIKYKDEDGDLITIYDSTDLSFAIQCSRILKITLFVNGQPRPIEGDELKHIRCELQTIRNRVNGLLDRLEPPAATTATAPVITENHEVKAKSSEEVQGNASHPAQPVSAAGSKEFDPLSAAKPQMDESVQSKIAASFGLPSGDAKQARMRHSVGKPPNPQVQRAIQPRSDTPNSISSLGSGQGQEKASTPQNYAAGSPGPQRMQAPYYNQQGQGQGQQQQYTGQSGGIYSQAQAGGYTQTQTTYTQPGGPQQNAAYPTGIPPQTSQQQYPSNHQTSQPQQYPGSNTSLTSQPQPQHYPGANNPQQSMYQQPQGYPQGNISYGGQVENPQQYSQYGTPGQQPNQVPPTTVASASSNPYARAGPTYGQYPRPTGQYPQAYQ